MTTWTVLMFEFDYELVEEADVRMRLEFECLERLKGILDVCRAEEVEDVMYLFQDPVDAIMAALQIRDLTTSISAQLRSDEKPTVVIKGYGIHLGEVLNISGTDVHWGDPINTASKLGQDLATDGEIIISDATYDVVQKDLRLKGVVFDNVELHKSKITFNCYKVRRQNGENTNNGFDSEIPLRSAEPKHSSWWDALFPKCYQCSLVCSDGNTEQVFQDVASHPAL